ncbi:ATP-binding cassette domain-containing protein [Thaumasiovibrio subtropicus]|uniref:ATP-binding cassette domain-containing protein n=1 Tax=Thaumasiovibrio subtropicus TaxID=1891207 RepID=UPI000B35DAFC|nr:ATP-binding cassette domain-containing protein [Thaumasiovibrio subtropicus]
MTQIVLHSISLRYGSEQALDHVSLTLQGGEIHALTGAHRSGKSSLVRILSGASQPDEGNLFIDGETIERHNPAQALERGIATVYQNESIMPTLSAMENIFQTRLETRWWGGINYRHLNEQARRILAELDCHCDVTIPVERLSKSQRHRIEIARAISLNPKLLILDEVSSRLTAPEMEHVYRWVKRLAAQGSAVLFITTSIEEIFNLADRVSVLNDGCLVETDNINDIDKVTLINRTYVATTSREELEKQHRELFYFKRYNDNIIKNLPLGVVIFDAEDEAYIANTTAARLLGLSRSDVEALTLNALAEMLELDSLAEDVRARRSATYDTFPYTESCYIDVSVYPFYDSQQIYLGAIVMLHDKSQHEKTMQYMLSAEKSSTIAQLAAGVAHEINNPLATVHNYLEILKNYELPPDALERVGRIGNEVRRISDIVKSLLSFSRNSQIALGQVEVVSLTREVILLLQHRISKAGVEIVLPFQASYDITTDENKFKQLLINLIVNALDAIVANQFRSGSTPYKGRISLVLRRSKGYDCLDITDNGIGMTQDVQQALFTPFFTTKADKYNCGLGLAICDHIVQLHQGIIDCYSREGEGTTFTVQFPRSEG